MAQYDYQARKSKDLSFRKGKAVNIILQWPQLTGDAFKIINNEDDDRWLMHLFETENEGYVPTNYMVPMERDLSSV